MLYLSLSQQQKSLLGPQQNERICTGCLQYDVISLHCVKWYCACEVVAFYFAAGRLDADKFVGRDESLVPQLYVCVAVAQSCSKAKTDQI